MPPHNAGTTCRTCHALARYPAELVLEAHESEIVLADVFKDVTIEHLRADVRLVEAGDLQFTSIEREDVLTLHGSTVDLVPWIDMEITSQKE